MISNFSRNATIADSEFVWVGESAIVSVGSTEKIDGTKGDQPRGNQILRNLIHEVGIFGKQTAGYVQAMSCQTTLKNNVMFNGPRAGINFLDGFGGGNLVQGNALWNWVRETGDQCAPPSQMRSSNDESCAADRTRTLHDCCCGDHVRSTCAAPAPALPCHWRSS